MSWIPNQPVSFLPRGSSCGCKPDNYCQPIFPSDITNFLLPNKCVPSTGSNLLGNPTFTGFEELQPIADAYWSQDDSNGGTNQWIEGTAYINGAPLSKILKQTIAITAYATYTFSVTMTGGTNCSLVLVGYNSDGTYDIIGEFTETGSITFSSTKGFVAIGFYEEGTCTNPLHRITEVGLSLVTWSDCVSIDVIDKAGNVVGSGDVIGYYDNFVWCQVDWSTIDLEAGNCYRICVDGFFGDNLFTYGDSGTFEDNIDDLSFLGSSVAWDDTVSHGGQKSVRIGVTRNTTIMKVSDSVSGIKLNPNTDYIISLWMKRSRNDNVNVALEILNNAAVVVASTTYNLSPVSAEWVQIEVEYTSGSTGDSCIIKPRLVADNSSGWDTPITIWLDDVVVYEEDAYSDCSQPFCIPVKEKCTSLITYSNNEDAFGFIYPPDFEFNMRLAAQLGKPKYPPEINSYDYDTGKRVITFASSRKISSLFVEDSPEYVHDALRLAVLHDNISINGAPYVVESKEYNPEWREKSELAPIRIDVAQTTQDTRNDYL